MISLFKKKTFKNVVESEVEKEVETVVQSEAESVVKEKNTCKSVAQTVVKDENTCKSVVKSEVYPVVESVDIYKHKHKQYIYRSIYII